MSRCRTSARSGRDPAARRWCPLALHPARAAARWRNAAAGRSGSRRQSPRSRREKTGCRRCRHNRNPRTDRRRRSRARTRRRKCRHRRRARTPARTSRTPQSDDGDGANCRTSGLARPGVRRMRCRPRRREPRCCPLARDWPRSLRLLQLRRACFWLQAHAGQSGCPLPRAPPKNANAPRRATTARPNG